MKNLSVFLAIFVPFFCFSQVNETFLDGNFINNPIWTGTSSNFSVNTSMQLQSKAAVASTSYLFTPSEAIDDATWECWVKINYNPSSGNYASIYLVSDKNDLTSGCNGYYVQVGGTNDEVSLFVQEGTTKTKIIDGVDKRTDRNPVDLRVKVTRDADGNFALYSKLATEIDYVLEGTIQNTAVKSSNYFGLLYVNTASTGLYYFFDDILVTGNKAVDKESPIWNLFNLETPNKLKLGFSEAMDFSASTFTVDNGMGNPISTLISADKTSIELTFANDFEKGKIYNLQTTGLADLAGNVPSTTEKAIGIVEKKEIGDLIFNEVMFENPENSLEYIEIYNKSDKLLDVSGMVFTTRKTDGTMNTGVSIPKLTPLLPPKGYLALCSNAETVRSFHACPPESNIISTSWTTLNNESSTLVLTSAAKDSIFDELKYDVKWHNSWVVSPKGISLERTSPDLMTQDAYSWHSSTAVGNNGTPGYQNSVYVDTEFPVWNSIVIEQPNKLKLEFSERMNFTSSTFTLDNGMGSPVSTIISTDKTSIELTFGNDFQKGKIYNLQTTGLSDLAGNVPSTTQKSIGIVEKKEIGDLIFNEVMFENPENSLEYIEIYNKSDKLLDVSGMIFTTRKTDGTMNTGVSIPKQTPLLPPKGYLALCSNAETVRSFHACPPESTIISTSWTALNNESSTLVLTSAAKDSIFDELKYDVKWHNSWVVSPKGIALERTSPDLMTQDAYSWHSSTAVGNNGTPGYQNSVYVDTEFPVWNSLIIEQPNKLKLEFSERMDFSASTFTVDNGMGNPISTVISADKTSIELTFVNDFQKGKIYNLQTSGLIDLAGNQLELKSKSIGIVEKKEIGDLIFNEVMFENPENSLEYIEIYNKSDKLLDVSGMVFTTRKTDGTMNTGISIPKLTPLLPPKGYLALCSNAETVRSFHACPPESTIISTSWTALNNESSTLVLTSAAKDSIFDELKYDVKWQNSWVVSPKGISLERTSPDVMTQDAYSWHSSTAVGNNGTPGYQNSVYVDTEQPIWNSFTIEQPNKLKLGFSERMDFSASTFTLDNGMGSPVSTILSADKTSIELTFANDFQKGKIYNLQTSGLSDLAGNQPELNSKCIGIVEKKEIGDLIFNEVMFENPENSLEYIEIYNKSDKLLDVSGMIFTTRKTDGTMNTGVIIPKLTPLLQPKGYLALCSNAETVKSFHACPPESNIISTSWTTLNNESSTLVLTSAAKDSIFDELKYDVKWHNFWVVSPKGISLERTSPDLITQDAYSWHSSTAVGNYGTPGYQNSVYVDTEQPIWNSFTIEQPNKLKLGFSERMDFSASTFTLDNGMGSPVSTILSADKTSIELTFANDFQKGKIYNLQTSGLSDLGGNQLELTKKSVGIVEKKEIGDLIFNEVMFENPENSLEYIEIYNKSDKLLDVSGMIFTTRKTDGTMNTGVIIPKLTPLLPPKGYLALCSNAETVKSFHACPPESNIISTSWTALNNESSTLVLTSAAKDSIFEELKYDVKWHNSWVVSPKGISLERTSPDLMTQDAYSWHSANSNNNYGTPGYQNSVYVDTELPVWNSIVIEQPNKLKLEFSERMNFSMCTFALDNGMSSPISTVISADKTSIELTFGNDFEKGKIYNLQTTSLADLAGNLPSTTQKSIGIIEKKEIGDLIFNEVMFENPETSLEYIEIYNKSDKLLDVSGMIFTTRKTDGTMNTGVIIPKLTPLLPPKGYLALCSNAETVRSFHACPPQSTIISTSWTALNNESSTLVLTSAAKDSIFDELKYDVKWHNSWVVSPKGIALERTSPDLITQDAYSWHSSTAVGNNGTPGYQNSVYVDTELPVWNSLIIEQPNKLKLGFSERMNFSASTFTLDNGMGSPVSKIISTDKTSIELTFASNFEKGKIYNMATSGLTDLAGNIPTTTQKSIGIVEKKEIGDLIFNEVMFENPENSLEYIEIYNKSDKLLDVSGMIFTTRKTDGTMNTGVIIPKLTPLLPPKGYLALCSNAETVKSFHACPPESNIISTSWTALNNESSTLVLTSAAKDSIFDELKYDVKWHNFWVVSPKGISLERTSPDLITQDAYSWHSSTAVGNNGTPGYQNSVYVDTDLPIWNSLIIEQPNKLKLAFSERMNFSASTFTVDNGMGSPISTLISADKTSIELTFANDFQKGKIYNLQTSGLIDLAGNQLELKSKSIGIVEKKEIGDLIFNEVMFENPENSLEYIEIYNKSDKLLDVSGMVFTTRKTDGTMNTGVIIPKLTPLLPPKGHMALCSNAETVRSFHACPPESNIISTSWTALNNESSTLVLTSAAKDSIFDELKYDVKWHNSWVVSPKGISLERTSPDVMTQDAYSWHSSTAVGNNGTPGYQNSVYVDTDLPVWNSLIIEQPNKLKLAFSERMNFSASTFTLDNGMGNPVSTIISADKTSIELTFANDFQKGKIYNLQTSGLSDLGGNQLELTKKSVGIVEKKEIGDLIFNEVMFENPENSLEYIEIYNKSDKLLDVSGMVFATRKTDGTMNTGVIIPPQTHILPHGYLALCSDAELLCAYYSCPEETNIISTTWNSLNNESTILVLTNSAKDSIFDELQYNVKWHNALVKNPKGVSLERINSNLVTQAAASWHSAASTTNFGTPGYQNSQFRDLLDAVNVDKFVWTEPESFSPDNDGINDVCVIKYRTDAAGYVANVMILNAVGVRVVTLGANILLPTEGFLIWDGKTGSGKNANVGIYVLYFEMFNPNTGERKHRKLPIVVSSL
ncbi:MAG: hypothetical protein JZU53_11390 [Paludibacter sp.]|nr:hypothetical protein [Paludibacter sp.]